MNRVTKKAWYALCLLFVNVGMHVAYGQNAATDHELFSQANELYKKDDFAKSYTTYSNIQHKTPVVHYNLGNCAYKMNKLGTALLHWRRAENDWGVWDRDEVTKNIAIVRKQLKERESKEPKEKTAFVSVIGTVRSCSNWTTSLIRTIPLLYLQIIVLLLWLFLFLYAQYLYRNRYKVMFFAFFVILTIASSMLVLKYSFIYRKQLVVTQPSAPILSGPGSTFATLGQLPEGSEAVIIKESGDYYKIRINGTTGWMSKQAAGQI